MKGVQRAFGKGKLLVTLLSQCRWALFSANSLLALEACNLYPTFLTHDSSKRNIPAAFNSSASLSQAVNETGFEKKNRYLRLLFFFLHIPTSCFYARSPDHLPSVFTREVCPICLELHHVQWRGGVHLPEQPVRLPVCGGVPAVQLPHH